MKFNIKKISEVISLLTMIIYLEPQLFKEPAFTGVEKIDFVYKILKLSLAFIIFVGYFWEKKKPSKLVSLLFFMQGIMLLSTILNSGSIFRFVGPAITTIVMAMTAELLLKENKLIKTLKSINAYLLICYIINLISIILIDFTKFSIFTKVYFLGIDNRFVFTFIPWIFFEGIVSIKENNKLSERWLLITILCEIVLLYKSSVAAMIVMLIFTITYYYSKIMLSASKYKNLTLISYIAINISIVLLKIQNIFEPIIKMLGKDITLSGRMYIWDGIIKNFGKIFFIGGGTQTLEYDKKFFFESSAPYYLKHCSVGHAHNSLMTLLYRGGLLCVFIYLYIIYITLNKISKNRKSKYSSLMYITIIAILILSIFDTIDLACLYFIIAICHNPEQLINEKVQNQKNSVINKKIDRIYEVIIKGTKKIYRIILISIFNRLPIKSNRIIFSSYNGKGYGDSGKYIVEELLKKNINYEMYWMVENERAKECLPPNIKSVKKDSLKYFYIVCTSKIWVDNRRPIIELTKRKEQFYIQTWHGGIALKKIEGDAEDKLPKRYIKCARKDSKAIDLMVSNSKFCTEMYKRAFWFNGRILECGTPRNDILINDSKHKQIREKVYKTLKIDKDYKIIMYAPTFRADENLECYNIEYEKLLNYLNKDKETKWKLLLKLHPNIANKSTNLSSENIIDASNYSDMYELMITADILITDYSSVMFEFSFMKKPVFLYATDIEEYLDERGLYFEYKKLPYKIAENTNELIENIKEFNKQSYEKNISCFFKKLGLNETGKAAELVAEEIIKVIEGEQQDEQ